MDRIQEHLLEEWLPGRSESVDPDLRLLDLNVLDSVAVFDLAQFFEEEFGISVPQSSLTRENFATIRDMDRLVRSLVREGGDRK